MADVITKKELELSDISQDVLEKFKRVKANFIPKAFTGGEYPEGVMACLQRAKFHTESWAKTESLPAPIRRAKALENVLNKITIFIKDDELIVGYNSSEPNRIPAWPEFSLHSLEEAIDGKTRKYIDNEDMDDLKSIVKFWQGKSLKDLVENDVFFKTDEGKEILKQAKANCTFGSTAWASNMLVGAVDYDFIFKHGLNGIINIIEERIEREKKEIPATGPGFFESLDKFAEWEAMIISCKAVINWANRYSKLALDLAGQEMDPVRKNELEEISRVCNRVPANPPEHFQESLQCYFFIWLVTHFLEQSGEGAPIRMDQSHWPFYEKDVIINKTLSQEKAVELLGLLRYKFAECGRLGTYFLREAFQGASTMSGWTIGGVKADGSNAFNELTESVVMASVLVATAQPNVILRYAPPVPEKIKRLTLDSIRQGSGFPSFINDELHTEALLKYGIPLEDARSWVIEGCCVSHCASSNGLGLKSNPSFSFLPAKLLELALNDGVEIYPGSCVTLGELAPGAKCTRLGPATGTLGTLKTYEDVREAFRKQIVYALQLGQKMRDFARHYESRYFPEPFLSSLYPTTIEAGKDGSGWEAIPQTGLVGAGMIDAGDALAGLKKVVFEDKKYTMEQLFTALKADWIGYEGMRRDFLNAPKWGNDDDYADKIIKDDVFDLMADEFSKIKDYWGKTPMLTPQSVVIFWSQGKKTSALPSGRKNGDFLADAGTSPVYGWDTHGPTAVVKSCSKLDYTKFKGTLLNQRFSPASLKGEKGYELFYNYIDTWYELGVDHVQFNVVDNKTLRAAQKEPERHKDLLVRVAGYSAYFVMLNEDTQDSIVQRTEQILN